MYLSAWSGCLNSNCCAHRLSDISRYFWLLSECHFVGFGWAISLRDILLILFLSLGRAYHVLVFRGSSQDRMDCNGVYNEARPLKWSPIVSRLLTMNGTAKISKIILRNIQAEGSTMPGIASKSNSIELPSNLWVMPPPNDAHLSQP